MSKKKTKGVLGIAKRCFVMIQAQFDKFKFELSEPNEQIWQIFDYIFDCFNKCPKKENAYKNDELTII
jgi:hypothetical protein